MEQAQMGAAHASQINAGSRLYALTSRVPLVVVAGGGDDNVFKDGTVIDRTAPALFLSGQHGIVINPTLNTGETVTVSRRYRHADLAAGPFTELPSMPDDDPSLAAVVITAAEMVATPGPRTFRDNLDLAGAKQFVRCDVKVDLSRANTDTCGTAGVLTLGGVDSGAVS